MMFERLQKINMTHNTPQNIINNQKTLPELVEGARHDHHNLKLLNFELLNFKNKSKHKHCTVVARHDHYNFKP